jgi:hypothetical protein
MKSVNSIIILLFFPGFCLGQSFRRQSSESKDSLIHKFQDENSSIVGKTYEFNNPNSSYILYFEIKPQGSLPNIEPPSEFGFSPYTGVPTVTLFNILYSTDLINYTKYIIDTLDINSGCCPCHFPDIVDSILFTNKNSNNELILLLTHPVKFDCNSATYHYALFYNDFETSIIKKEFSLHPIRKEHYYPLKENSSDELIKYFRTLKSSQ